MNPLPILPAEQRRRIVRMPATRAVHDRLLKEMPFLEEVELQPPPPDTAAAKSSLRVVSWNAERCRRLDAAACFLLERDADLILLTEMDWGMARSGQLHTARELAGRLQCGYAFAIEFLELGLGDAQERKLYKGQENSVGYHGAAILFSGHPIDVRVLRLEQSAGWFGGRRGERRVGGRIALLARFFLSGIPVTFAAVHLESDTDAEDRAAQMQVLFDAVDSNAAGQPALIGGDLNTFSLSHADLNSEKMLQRAVALDPNRLSNPVAYEPLFALAGRYGYQWEASNQANKPTQRPSPAASSGHGQMKIDWFLTRGLEVFLPEVIEAVDPKDGSDLSDHEAIAVSVEARAG